MGNAPNPESQSDAPKESFLKIPLKGWAVATISLIAVCAALAHYSIGIYGEWQDQKNKAEDATNQKDRANIEKDRLESLNQITSRNTNLVTQEMKKHESDNSGHQFHLDNAGKTIATYFESDGCIIISRPGKKLPYLDHPGDRVEVSLGPSLTVPSDPSVAAPPVRLEQADPSAIGKSSTKTKETIRQQSRINRPRLLKVQAGCLNPHPWPFQSWWGPANGCFAPLYRKWNDGCTHYQFYNSCNGQWDPRIFWTVCNPNHHQ
jgi:hypothetical protein